MRISGNSHIEVTMKFQKSFYTFVNTAIRILLVLIVSGLLLQSLFSTSFIGVVTSEAGIGMERTRNIADDPWRHLLVFAVFTAVGILIRQIVKRRASHPALQTQAYGQTGNAHANNDKLTESAVQASNSGLTPSAVQASNGGLAQNAAHTEAGSRIKSAGNNRIFCYLSLFTIALWTFWILITQLEPGSDPAKVYGIAMQWREGNFSAYAEGGYLFRYPYQAGIILFYYLLSFVFGVDNYIGLQFVNVIALAAVYVLLSKLAAFFWKKEEKLPVLVYMALLLWTPLAFYVTYLYGILPGMALSLGAVYGVAKYLDTGKYRYVLPACICMGFATVIKMNCLIYLIAAACFLVYDAIVTLVSEKRNAARALASLSVIVLMSLGVAGCNEAVNRYVEKLSGYEAGEGLEMLSWVVMGLQETPLGPGGYSGYIGDIYVKYDYDAEKVKEASWTDIKKALTRMAENPLDEGATFFARKNAFQWNDPSFISLDRTKGRNAAIELSGAVRSLIEGQGSVLFYVVMNYAQTLLLFGMLLYVFLTWRSRNVQELLGAVIFLGGYLFHFIWESSASYTIPYFVVMIPYGVKGLVDWLRYVEGLPAYMAQNRRGAAGKRELVRKLGAPVGGTVAAVILVVLLGSTNLFDKTFALDDGAEARAQFYQEEEKTPTGVLDGYYYLTPYAAQDMAVAEREGKVTLVSLDQPAGADVDAENPEQKIYFHNISRRKLKQSGSAAAAGISLRFRSNEQVLAVEQSGDGAGLTVYMDDGMNMFYEEQDKVSYLWNLYGTPEQGYYIVQNGLALTYRDGAVTLEAHGEREEQRWMLR